jgi:hypothetical protein
METVPTPIAHPTNPLSIGGSFTCPFMALQTLMEIEDEKKTSQKSGSIMGSIGKRKNGYICTRGLMARTLNVEPTFFFKESVLPDTAFLHVL